MTDWRASTLLLLIAGCSGPSTETSYQGPKADQAFLRAEACFQAGDYAQSVLLCEHALRLDPDHVLARGLLEELESLAAEARKRNQVHGRALLTIMDWRLTQAANHYAQLQLVLAESEACEILSFAMQLPPGYDCGDRVERAEELLRWIRAAKD